MHPQNHEAHYIKVLFFLRQGSTLSTVGTRTLCLKSGFLVQKFVSRCERSIGTSSSSKCRLPRAGRAPAQRRDPWDTPFQALDTVIRGEVWTPVQKKRSALGAGVKDSSCENFGGGRGITFCFPIFRFFLVLFLKIKILL